MVDQLITMWCDRHCQYFIVNAEVIDSDEPMYQDHWRKVSENTYSDAENFGLDIINPILVKS